MKRVPKKARLLIVFGNLGIGGVQRKIVDIVQYTTHVIQSPVTIDIVLRDQPTFRFDRESIPTNVSLHVRPNFRGWKLHIPFSIYIFWKIFSLRPTSVLTFYATLTSFVLVAKVLLFWRAFTVAVNEDIFPSAHNISGKMRLLIRLCYPYVNTVIVPTKAAYFDLVRHFNLPRNNIVVIPNWTRMPRRSIATNKRCDVLYIGRFEPQKNLLLLLKCVRSILKSNDKFKLCLIGEGSQEEELLKYISANEMQDNVQMIRSTHSIQRKISCAKVVTLSSHYEGMSVAVLEAMATGTPVVVTRHPGSHEYILHGKTGFIANTRVEYIHFIQLLLSNERLRVEIAKNAQRDVSNRFSHGVISRFISAVLIQKNT